MMRVAAAALAVAGVVAIYVRGLDGAGVLSVDEPRYAAIGREMARSGDWVTPRLWGSAWFEKPALLYWMVAAGTRLGLPGEWAPRLPVALLSAAFLAFYFAWLRRLLGAAAAAYATAVLATSAGWIGYSRTADTDLPLAATFAAAMLLAIPWATGAGGGRGGAMLGAMLLWPVGALLGLAVLAKGPVAIILALPMVWLGRRRWRELWRPLLAMLAVAAPWYWAMWSRHGWEFVDVFLIRHNLGRVTSDELQHARPFWFYAPVLLAGLVPWTPAAWLLARRENGTNPVLRALALWSAWTFVLFSVARNKLPGYLLPMMPAVAAIVGYHLAKPDRPRWILPISWFLLCAAASLIPGVLPVALDRGLSRADLQPAPILAVVAIAAVAMAFGPRRGHWGMAVVVATCAIAAWSILPTTLGALDRVTARPLWNDTVRRLVPEVCIEPDMRRTLRYGLNYYAVEPLPDCVDSPRLYRLGALTDRLH
jgi:4-amino-4-deoxy-L-arabinose transferase-like glycosyltransferase